MSAWDWDNLSKQRGPGQSSGSGGGAGPLPPQLDEILARLRRIWKKLPGLWLVVIVAVVIWGLTGIYIVGPDERGIVTRFGAYVRSTGPGPHYALPYPIERVLKPKVTKVYRLEIGFRSIRGTQPARYSRVLQESLMLTGDENIVDIQFIVQYRIKDAVAFLFNVKDQRATVMTAAEASMREIVGRSNIDEALTTGKAKLQNETKQLLQRVLDSYKAGIQIVAVQLQDVHPPAPVIDAFKDVASAKEDKQRFINTAMGYKNRVVPIARGLAEQLIRKAEAYARSKVARAQGDAARFVAILKEYKKAPEVTRLRLYLETLEKVLANTRKVVLSGKGGRGVLPLLPLQGLGGAKGPAGSGR